MARLVAVFGLLLVVSQASLALDGSYGKAEKFSVTGPNGGRLVTFKLAADGRLYALVGTGGGYGPTEPTTEKPSHEVVILNTDGKVEKRWNIPFAGERLAVAADGTVVVAGSGRIGKFKNDGQELVTAALPHIDIVLADKEELKAAAEEQHQEMLEMYKQQVQQFEQLLEKKNKAEEQKKDKKDKKADKKAGKQQGTPEKSEKQDAAPAEKSTVAPQTGAEQPAIVPALTISAATVVVDADGKGTITLADTVEAKPAAEATEGAVEIELDMESYLAQIPKKQLEQMVKQYKEELTKLEKLTPEKRLEQFIDNFKGSISVHSVEITKDAICYVARGVRGYGYALWQVTADLKDPKKVLDGLGGCCGQCDVHVHDGKLFVADNTKHRVSVFDDHGKAVTHFGKTARGGSGDGFGGCCNPMNLCFGPGGEILTAESEGIVKLFTPDGKFERVVATAVLEGGCKHVPLSVTANGKYLFFLDQPGSNIIRLTQGTEQSLKVPASE